MSKPMIVHPAPPAQKVVQLLQAFLSGRNELTIRAYAQDLADFAAFLRAPNAAQAARGLLALAPGDANALALSYRTDMLKRGFQAATVNRRLAALRALVKLARTLGIVLWSLEVSNLKIEQERDLRGPARTTLKKVLHGLAQSGGAKAKRDTAILRLLHDLGLRRGEVVSLDLAHVSLGRGTVSVLGKGRAGRVSLTLPNETKAALSAWIEARGSAPGPLFTNFDRAKKGRRLTGMSVYRLTQGLGLGRPHGVRHLAITEALDLMDGDVRKVQRFSRHRDLRVLNVYDDNRQDLAGEVARIVASNV